MVEQLTQPERDEIFLDACDAFAKTIIDEKEFIRILVRIGYNASEIEDEVRLNAPQP